MTPDELRTFADNNTFLGPNMLRAAADAWDGDIRRARDLKEFADENLLKLIRCEGRLEAYRLALKFARDCELETGRVDWTVVAALAGETEPGA